MPTTMMQPTMITALLLFAALLPSSTTAELTPADCSTCDESLTKQLFYGCNGDVYVTYDDTKVTCGQALTLSQLESTPKFYHPTADKDALYALMMVDTTFTDPKVGTVAPFLPFPIIHYGAMNIPGDVLIDGMSLGAFHKGSDNVIRVTPFVEYQTPVPSEELKKVVTPGEEVPDLNKRAINYEFMLAKQKYEKDDPLMDKYSNWEFVGFLKRNTDINTVMSTYVSTGYCVKETEEGAYGSDCLVSAETESGVGCVPAHVVNKVGGTPCADVPGGPSGNNPGVNGSDKNGSDASTAGNDSSSAFAYRWSGAAAFFSVLGLICGNVAV